MLFKNKSKFCKVSDSELSEAAESKGLKIVPYCPWYSIDTDFHILSFLSIIYKTL